jgi:hypothetical protein
MPTQIMLGFAWSISRRMSAVSSAGTGRFGVARPPTASGAERRSYRCAGKDRTFTARETACPRAEVDTEVMPNERTKQADLHDGSRFRNTEVLTLEGDKIRKVEVYFGWNVD